MPIVMEETFATSDSLEETFATSDSLATFLNNENTSVYDNLLQNNSNYYYPEQDIGILITLVCYPVIIIIGTIGNILTFIVMQRGSLKESSTCFYMAVLALSDTCK